MAELRERDLQLLARFNASALQIQTYLSKLEALPVLKPLEPSPPACHACTAAQLDAFWTEHDQIAVEVEKLDTGDLVRLRALARAASQKEMSKDDTDLVELTLSTLFSLDQLLNLLRVRGRNLDVLELRLQWDQQRNQAQKEHTALLKDIPRFVGKARWVQPSTAMRKRRSSSVSTSSNPNSPTKKKRASLGSKTLSNLSISSAAADSPLGGGPTSSIMARRMRHDILALSLASTSTRIQSLTNSLIPTAGKSLDSLIDASPARLPDCFLDVQERLEDEANELCDGMPDFLASMVGQWSAADEVFWEASDDVVAEAENLKREIEEEFNKTPTQRSGVYFQQRLDQLDVVLKRLRTKLQYTRRALTQTGSPEPDSASSILLIPLPTHSRMPEQLEMNKSLLETLDATLAEAAEALSETKALRGKYAQAADALERTERVRSAVEQALQQQDELLTSLAQAVSSLPSLEHEDCLDEASAEEQDASSRIATVCLQLEGISSNAAQFSKDISQCLLDLQATGVGINLRSELRDLLSTESSASKRASTVRTAAQNHVELLAMARSLWHAEEDALGQSRTLKGQAREAVNAALWSGRQQGVDCSSRAADLLQQTAQLFSYIDDALKDRLLQASSDLSDIKHKRLLSYLDLGASRIRHQCGEIVTANDLHTRAIQHATAVDETSFSLSRLSNRTHVLQQQMADLLSSEDRLPDEIVRSLDEDLTALRAASDECLDNLHRGIPMLSGDASGPATPAVRVLPLASSAPSFALSVTLKPVMPQSPAHGNHLTLRLQREDTAVREHLNHAAALLTTGLVDLSAARGRLSRLVEAHQLDADLALIEQAGADLRERLDAQQASLEHLLDPEAGSVFFAQLEYQHSSQIASGTNRTICWSSSLRSTSKRQLSARRLSKLFRQPVQ